MTGTAKSSPSPEGAGVSAASATAASLTPVKVRQAITGAVSAFVTGVEASWAMAASARLEIAAPAAVSNTLTYTAGPNLRDQITLAIMWGFRALSNLIGVDVFAAIGKAMESSGPPSFLTFGLTTQTTTYTSADGTNWTVWEFQASTPSGKTVIALHGGGFVDQPEFLHWIDYTSMARDTGATVIVPLYPLATTEAGSANVLIPEMADFVSKQIAQYGAQNVSVYGDSAGSTIAMATMRQLILDSKPLPSSMVLLSLAADYSVSNPDIAKVADPIFDIHSLSAWNSHFTDGISDTQHSMLSPLFYDPAILAALPPTTIYVGQNEILYPDTLLLYQQAVQDDSPISVVVGTGVVHDWPLTGLPIYSQGPVVRPAIYRELGLTGPVTGSQVAGGAASA
jgi:acetyl esterase/lipase